VSGEFLVQQEYTQHKARIFTALGWKSWENKVCASIKQGFSQHKAGQKSGLAPEFHQSRLQYTQTLLG